MALISTVVRFYNDAQKTTMLRDDPHIGPNTSLTTEFLAAGKKYYVTVQSTDSNNIQSPESDVYFVATFPDIEFDGTPSAGDRFATIDLLETTDDVAITIYGIEFSEDSSFTDIFTFESDIPRVDCWNLEPHTTYYIRPYVIDEYDRKYVNVECVETISTPYSVPIVTWIGSATSGVSSIEGVIDIESELPVTSAVVRYFTHGGGTYHNVTLLPQTGEQRFEMTGLDPNTAYDVRIQAVNATGTGASETLVLSTLPVQATMRLNITDTQVDPQNNNITVTSKATYDSSVNVIDHSVFLSSNGNYFSIPVDTQSGGAADEVTVILGNANPSQLYYVYSILTYDINGVGEYRMYSDVYKVETYSLISIGAIGTDITTADIPYAVVGDATSVQLEYSKDQTNWLPVPASSLNGGTIRVENLDAATVYYVRARSQSEPGWETFKTSTFTTESDGQVTVTISSITDAYNSTANVNLTIIE